MRRSLLRISLAVLAAAAALLAVPGPARASVANPYAPDVVVATAADGERAYFPDLVRLPDGRLLAAWREGPDHAFSAGRIKLAESDDGGRSWSPPWLAADTPYDDRDPKLMRLRSGALLLSFFETDWSTAPAVIRGTFVVRSDDDGRTWSQPVKISTHMDGPSSVSGGTYWLGGAASHGEILELPNGDLLAPLYGTLPTDPWNQATVVRSTDGGRSWSLDSEITLAAQDGVQFYEPVLALLRSGELVCLIRTAGRALLTRSDDNGHTWTTPVVTDLWASSAHLLVTREGGLLATYGDVSKKFSPGRPTRSAGSSSTRRGAGTACRRAAVRRQPLRRRDQRPGQPVERGGRPGAVPDPDL